MKLKTFSRIRSACLLAVIGAATIVSAKKPNIILYLSDDVGYGDLAFMGHPYAKTPNMDRMASEGTVFMQHYVTGVTCAPSRTGIMTGVHPSRYPFYPRDFGYGDQPTITQLLHEAGYSTGHFGKWHLGPEDSVGTYGIQEVFTESNNKNDFNTPARDEPLTDRAIEFIERMAKEGKPFYANVWGHSTHSPVKYYHEYAKEVGDIPFDRNDFKNPTIQQKFDESLQLKEDLKDSMTHYLADIYGIDKNLGRILDLVDRLGIADNTIIVYSSDHGPDDVGLHRTSRVAEFSEHNLGDGGLLRGGKHRQWEGGVRVPFIIRWPGKIEAGRVDHESVTSFIDWLPTLCNIVGIQDKIGRVDGEDITDIWFEGPRARNTDLFWRPSVARTHTAMREGKWKFHESSKGPLLYDVVNDPGESKNLANEFPEVAERLAKKAKAWRASLPDDYLKDTRFLRGQEDLSTVDIPEPMF